MKAKMFFRLVQLILVLVVFFACGAPPSPTSHEDCDVSSADPDIFMIPVPVETEQPKEVTAAPPVEWVKPAPTCVVGAIKDLGEGFNPRIAGSASGYAIGYPEYWGQKSYLTLVNQSGGQIRPPWVLMAHPMINFAEVVSGARGYIASTVASGDVRYHNVVRVNPDDGQIIGASLSQQDLWQLHIVGGDMVDRATWVKETNQPNCDWTLAYGAVDDNAKVNSVVDLECYTRTSSLGVHSGASKGDVTVLGVGRYTDMGNGSGRQTAVAYIVRKNGTSYSKTEFPLESGEAGKDGLSIPRVVRTEQGFALLWSRFTYVSGSFPKMETFITQLDSNASFKGTVQVPNAYDMAWNGKEFGLVFYDETRLETLFHWLKPDGEVVKTSVVSSERTHYASLPKIAASGQNFGIVWAANPPSGANPHLRFAPIVCE